MNIEAYRDYCLAKKGVEETLPFGPDVLVFKVMGKMFAIINEKKNPVNISLKCDPLLAETLREKYDEVQPGYHLNKPE